MTPDKYRFDNGLDVYDFLRAIPNKDPAAQHAIKKLTNAGNRGAKGVQEDYTEAMWSIIDSIHNLLDYNQKELEEFLTKALTLLKEKNEP